MDKKISTAPAPGCCRCVICKKDAAASGVLSSSCDELIEKYLIQAFVQSMEIHVEGMEGLITIPFCRRCRDKVINLPGALANFRLSYALLQQTAKDLAFTAIESGAAGDMEKKSDAGVSTEADTLKDSIATIQARIREKIVQEWKPEYMKEKEKCSAGV